MIEKKGRRHLDGRMIVRLLEMTRYKQAIYFILVCKLLQCIIILDGAGWDQPKTWRAEVFGRTCAFLVFGRRAHNFNFLDLECIFI
jgi:hypothetical protein